MSKSLLKYVLLAIIVFLFLINKETSAQEYYNLSVSPPTFEYSAKPGDVIEGTIRAQNLTVNPLSGNIEIKSFVAIGEEGSVALTDDLNDSFFNNWITVDPSVFTILPKSQQFFNFKINIPLDAEPGGHFGSIVFKSGGNNLPNQTGAAVAQELATLVLIKVAGDTIEKAQILSFGNIKKFFEYGPVDFDLRLMNLGNTHLKPNASVIIKNIFNKDIKEINFEPKNILPGAVRKGEVKWDNKWLFGKYTAYLTVNFGNPAQALKSSFVFYGLPYRLMFVVLVSLLLFFYFLYRGRRRISKALKILFSKDH